MSTFPYAGLVVLLVLGLESNAQPASAPQWARGMVWYQILPDRFCNGDTLNDPTADEIYPDRNSDWEVSRWTSNWYTITIKELLFSESFYDNAFRRQYGGDLEGIIQKLPYLESLGVDGIILSPVFESHSSHKFDMASYHHIDPRFGPKVSSDTSFLRREVPDDPKSWYLTSADRKFIELIDSVHRKGMKVVIDVQFAHVSVNFWAFLDVVEKQERSRFASWFDILNWDQPETPYQSEFRYKSMWGIEALPEIRKDTLGLVTGPKEYVLAAVRKWMDPNGDGDPGDGVDGWRVHLVNQIPTPFWKEWSAWVRSINKDVLLIAEGMIEDKTVRSLFDVVETDVFGRASANHFLKGSMTTGSFDKELTQLRQGLTEASLDVQWNNISGPETARLASMCMNPQLGFEEASSARTNRAYNISRPTRAARRLQEMLCLFQFTFPGAPSLYYGDEAGMWGSDDPDNRKPMLWPELTYEPERSAAINGDDRKYPVEFDSSVFRFYQKLIQLRSQHIALRMGDYKTILMDDRKRLYGFKREAGADKVLVVFNDGEHEQECQIFTGDIAEGIRVDAPLQGLHFYVEKGWLQFILPPKTGTILIPKY